MVVVLSGSMEPAFYRGDILFLHMGRKPLVNGEVRALNPALPPVAARPVAETLTQPWQSAGPKFLYVACRRRGGSQSTLSARQHGGHVLGLGR